MPATSWAKRGVLDGLLGQVEEGSKAKATSLSRGEFLGGATSLAKDRGTNSDGAKGSHADKVVVQVEE